MEENQHEVSSLAKLITSFAKAKLEMGKLIATEKANLGSYNYTYADMAGVLNVIDKPLASNGLVFVQSPVVEYGQGARVTVHGTLYHESGEFIHAAPLVMLSSQADPQKVGSAITYGRRYQAVAFFGLAQEDDDGKSAGEKQKQPQQQQRPVQQPPVAQHRPPQPAQQTPTPQPAAATNGHKPVTQPAPSVASLDDVSEAEHGAAVVSTEDEVAELLSQARQRFHGCGTSTFGPTWDDVRHAISVAMQVESSSQFTAPQLNALADSFKKQARQWQTWQRAMSKGTLPPVELAFGALPAATN